MVKFSQRILVKQENIRNWYYFTFSLEKQVQMEQGPPKED